MSAMSSAEDLQAQFEREYCPPLDSATLLAILQDYELTNAAQNEAARQILDILKEGAAEEEASGFDPSGSGWAQTAEDAAKTQEEGESVSARSQRGWTTSTDSTSISHGLSSLDLEASEYPERDGQIELGETKQTYGFDIEGLGELAKEGLLIGIFPSLKPFDIKWTLKKYNGDASSAIDELMTQSFLEESGTRHRGIEAFSENGISSRTKKGKGKKKKRRELLTEEDLEASDSPKTVTSKWETGRKDVAFISTRIGMPSDQVSSLYHNNGASLKSTIQAIITAHSALNLDTDEDAVTQLHVYELGQQFPLVPLSDLQILVQITSPSQAYAEDLAKALASQTHEKKPGIQLEFRHAPIDLDSGLNSPRYKPQSHNAVFTEGSTYIDPIEASTIASAHKINRNEAFSKAAAAYRKGKSDHLMGGAAAYYADLGKDFDARAKTAESAAADALVASQSSSDRLDLHGVTVKDALRISRERVTSWWHNLGDARYGGRAGAYKIVTGLGIHSKEGIAKLGPAVAKMLMREGWKVEVGQGSILVTGVKSASDSKRR